MIDATLIKEDMEVVGSDGERVGRVDNVIGQDIELAKFDFGSGLKHHLIPVSWVSDVDAEHVRLNRTCEAAKAEWREKQ
jgi:hypothetical protein